MSTRLAVIEYPTLPIHGVGGRRAYSRQFPDWKQSVVGGLNPGTVRAMPARGIVCDKGQVGRNIRRTVVNDARAGRNARGAIVDDAGAWRNARGINSDEGTPPPVARRSFQCELQARSRAGNTPCHKGASQGRHLLIGEMRGKVEGSPGRAACRLR